MLNKENFLKFFKNRGFILLFFMGIFLILFALQRIDKWEPVDIVILSGLGLIFLVVGIGLYLNPKPGILFIVGVVLSLIGAILYYLVFRYLSDIVAFDFALGMSLMFTDVFTDGKYFPLFSQHSRSDFDLIPVQHRRNMEEKWQEIINLTARPIDEYRQEIRRKDMNLGGIFDILLKQKDTLEKLEQDNKDPRIIVTLEELNEKLEELGIFTIEASPGTGFDPLKHEYHRDSNPRPDSSSSGKISKVVKKGYLIRSGNNEEILRKTIVVVNWGDQTTR